MIIIYMFYKFATGLSPIPEPEDRNQTYQILERHNISSSVPYMNCTCECVCVYIDDVAWIVIT